ncbi:MAG: hypothetical protein MK132_21080 [Lentisphaerales bacterium]|nr:hypothetical protein [Lentisphaerales bacterium]
MFTRVFLLLALAISQSAQVTAGTVGTVTLKMNTSSDLDLHGHLPWGSHIWYEDTYDSMGANLSEVQNIGGGSSGSIEVITFPEEPGHYTFNVDLYEDYEDGDNPFEIIIQTTNYQESFFGNGSGSYSFTIGDCSSCTTGCNIAAGVANSGLTSGGTPNFTLSIGNGPSLNMTLLNPDIGEEVNFTSSHFLSLRSLVDSVEELDLNDNLRQVKNDVSLTQIDVIDDDSYTVKLYDLAKVGAKDATGYYTVTGLPDTKLTFSKNTLTPNKVNIREEKGGAVIANTSYEYDESGQYWIMGRDNDGDGNFESFEHTTETVDGTNIIRTEHSFDGNSQLVSKVQRTYDVDYNLLEETISPDTNPQTTTYGYDEEGNQTSVKYPDGSSETTTYVNDKPELITRSSGYFTKYKYDGSDRVVKKIESFNGSEYTVNENDHKVTTYVYTPVVAGDSGAVDPDEARTVSVSLLGNPVSVTYYGYLAGETVTIQGATPTSAVNDANNLISRSFTNGEDEVTKEINPDGTGIIIDRFTDGTSLTVTTDTGFLHGDTNSIISGTSTVEIFENDLEVSTTVSDIATGLLISSRTVTSRDDRDRETRVDYHDGTFETFIYTCCNLDTSTSRDGVETTYTYDALDRQKTSTTNGVTRTNHYDALGNVVKVTETGTDGTVRTLSESHYNSAGQLAWTKDAQGKQTSFETSYPGDGTTVETTTYPNGKTRITATDSEGDIVSVTGTGVFHEDADIHNEYVELDAELGYHVHVRQYGKADNWTKTYTNALGRTYKTESSAGAVTRDYYDAAGDVIKSVAPNGAVSLFYTDASQQLNIQALDVNQNDIIDYGVDVITRSQSEYITENSVVYQRTRNWLNPDSLATPGTPDNTRKVSNDGLLFVNTSVANGITSTLKVITEIDTTGAITTTSMAPDGTSTESKVTLGLQDWVKSYNADGAEVSRVDYKYDNFNRLKEQIDSRNGTTTYTYDNSDRVKVLKTPDPDGNGPKAFQEFKTFYTDMGQRDYVVHPDGTQINFGYNDQGLIENASGSQVYPRTYGYDNKGNLTSLTTTGQAGSSAISWEYYDNGQLYKKTDARGREVTYTYYPSGQVKTKTNARGIVKTWTYDSSGRLDSISYSDNGLTPGYSFTYNDLGRLDTISDAGGDRKLNYNTLGQFTGYTWLSGDLSGLEQSYTYDLTGRQKTSGFSINGVSRANTYLYNKFGLLEEVDDGKNKYKYSYLDQAPNTVEVLEVEQNGTVQLHSKRAFDKLMRTTGLEWATGGKN